MSRKDGPADPAGEGDSAACPWQRVGACLSGAAPAFTARALLTLSTKALLELDQELSPKQERYPLKGPWGLALFWVVAASS